MTYSLTRFGIYDALKSRLSVNLREGEVLPAWKMALAASIAGGLGGIAGNPADVVLVRMTGDANREVAKRLNYRNCFDGVFRIVKEEGATALFRGVGPNVARAVLMNASQLATYVHSFLDSAQARLTGLPFTSERYDIFKNAILKTGQMDDGLALHFTSSSLAGTVATTVCAPFDVIKSRMMNAASAESVGVVIARAFKQEGFSWLFKGWTPAWIRLSPNTILIFMTLEQMKKMIDTVRSHP
ncbi:hypothetical protein P7C70_g2364, partial [Phenoliferia sp. Uapishka_3]